MRTALTLASWVLLLPGLLAQAEGETSSPPLGTVELSDSGEVVDPAVRSPIVNLQPEEPAGIVSADFFAARASLQPRRLAPGQSGTLHVLVCLRGPIVVRAADHIELTLEPDHEALTFGAPILQPPTGDRTEEANGDPVYADTILFSVPVRVRADAATGRYPVPGGVTLEVSGAGRPATTRVTGEIDGRVAVGAPLPQTRPSATRGSGEAVRLGTPPAEPRGRGAQPPGPAEEDPVGTSAPSPDVEGARVRSGPASGAIAGDEDFAPVELAIQPGLGPIWTLTMGLGSLGGLLVAWMLRRRR